MTQDPLFELTRSPQLNELIKDAEKLYTGEITDADFKEAVKKLNQFRRDMREFMRGRLAYFPLTPSMKREVDALETVFEEIRLTLEEIYRYFKDGGKSHVEEGLMRCKEAFSRMYGCIDRLQQEESQKPPYSEVPLQNDLMRLGYGAAEGAIRPEVFRDALAQTLYSLKLYYGRFDKMEPSAAEKAYYEENRENIRLALRRYIKALEEAELYFSDGDRLHLDRGLKDSAEAASEVFMHQQKLAEGAGAAGARVCVQCGAENGASEKLCGICGATLLFGNLEENSSVAFRQDENGEVRVSDHRESVFTREVSSAVADVRSAVMPPEKFASLMEEKIAAVTGALEEKKRLQIPQQLQEGHEASSFFNTFDLLMAEALKEMKEALETLLLYRDAQDDTRLIFGLESFLSGSDKLLQLKEIADSVKG